MPASADPRHRESAVPTYAYACTACDHRFEAHQSFSDDALTDCPQCQGRLRKLFNSVGIVFKGSGFYRTDSRAGANGADGAKGQGGSGTSSGEKTPGESTTTSKGGESTTTSSSSASGGSKGSKGSNGSSGSGSSSKVAATAGSAA